MGDLTRNFSRSEFACKDEAQTPVPDTMLPALAYLALQLQVIRDEVDTLITINSGYRTVDHNAAIGGHRRSRHLKAEAADMATPDGWETEDFHQLVLRLADEGKIHNGGIGLYPWGVHYDIQPRPRRWPK